MTMIETNGMQERNLATQKLVANAFMSRFSIERELALGSLSSKFFDGARDIYQTAGYPGALSVESYLGRYQRDALAYRIVTAAPDDTWRKPFAMLDGSTIEDGKADTEFVNRWNEFTQFDNLQGDLLDDSRRSIWHYFYDVDRQCGIGQYAVMVLGFNDGLSLDQPLRPNSGKKLLYVTVMNEYFAKVYPSSLVSDANNPRFGMPEFYHINYGDQLGTRAVHYSRVIHVAEGGVLMGKPRLEAVYNNLINVQKISAASGEASWRSITRKIIISSRDGYQLAEGTVTADKVSDMIHGLRDVVELEGADVNVVSGELVDPTGNMDIEVNLICAGTDIPKRKLFGAEAGKLASGQEEKQWNDNIQSRRTNFVDPVIVRPFIKRMIYAGLLSMPSSGNYTLSWPSLFETSDTEQATTFLTYAQGLSYLKDPGIERMVKPAEVVKYFVRGLPADAVPTKQELASMDAEAAQKQQDALELAKASQPQTAKADGMGGDMAMMDKGRMLTEGDLNGKPAVNSYSPTEQQAIFEAAIRMVANGQ